MTPGREEGREGRGPSIQAHGLDAMEAGDATAWDRGAGGELSTDELTLGMSAGGNVSWQTDNMNLRREEGGGGRGEVVILEVVEGVGEEGAPREG